MKPNKGDIQRTEETSLLEQVVEERSAELFYFDALIEDDSEFNISMVTMPDDFILRLHSYLIRKERRESFLHQDEAFDPVSARLHNMISRLEDLSVVQEHMNKVTAKSEIPAQEAVLETPKEKKKSRLDAFLERHPFRGRPKTGNR